MIGITDALHSLCPGAQWSIDGETIYDNIQWLSPDYPKPTRKEVSNETTRLQAEYDKKQYQRNRVKEYPPMTDYLDAVYWQSQGDDSKMNEYLLAIQLVKEKYPK